MLISELSPDDQIKIPEEVKHKLHMKSGDRITFEIISSETVLLRKIHDIDDEYAKALSDTLNEWGSSYDEEAYKDL